MPVRIVVHLLPSGPRSPVPPLHTGPAVYAAVLAAVRASDPTLATAIHERPRYKPLALSPLLDADDRPATAGSSGLRIEIGVLVDELTGAGHRPGCERVTIAGAVGGPMVIAAQVLRSSPEPSDVSTHKGLAWRCSTVRAGTRSGVCCAG